MDFISRTLGIYVAILFSTYFLFPVECSIMKATDNFMSPCPPVSLSSVPLFWSNSSTWPSGLVPGIGNTTNANVEIPCDTYIVLDLPRVIVGSLVVKGLLTFIDDPSVPLVYLSAAFIIVEGQFSIGTEEKQFGQQARIELVPSQNRTNYKFTSLTPADPNNPRDLGHKAFVVIGGTVSLHGLPGLQSMPVWCRLIKTANIGDISITVDCDASQWPANAKIAIASTSYDRTQTETFNINSATLQGNTTVLRLRHAVKFPHSGDLNTLSDGFGGYLDQRAEVALLSRNIEIRGLAEPAPYNLDGGHFMVFMTGGQPQVIEGTLFFNMGQQGTLGRYPIHFHVMGHTSGVVCRKNTIQSSNQRCVVVHASHDILIDSNVAYDNRGHCFINEEGGEMNNSFVSNLGMLTTGVLHTIKATGVNPPIENDDSAAVFWMTNGLNTFTGNVAAGSSDSGFWFDMSRTVRGSSQEVPELEGIVPFITYPTIFADNVAHSNANHGFRTYPDGMRPRQLPSYSDAGPGIIDRFNAYNNGQDGMFIHNTDIIIVRNSTFAGNPWGIHLDQDARITVEACRFVGYAVGAGSCPGNSKLPKGNFGIVINQARSEDLQQSLYPNLLTGVSFSNYSSACSNTAGIALLGQLNGDFWNPSHNSQGLKFDSITRRIFVAPRTYQFTPFGSPEDAGETSQFYTLFDKDGSLTGSRGYVVANAPKVLSPSGHHCTFKKAWNAYACAGACYRTVVISYAEPGFTKSPNNVNNKHGDFSYLKITRTSDGAEIILDGNLQSSTYPSYPPTFRFYFPTLLANQEYSVEIMAPFSYGATPFLSSQLRVSYAETGECGHGLSLRFRQNPATPWALPQSLSTGVKQCPGAALQSSAYSHANVQIVCMNSQPWLRLTLSYIFTSTVIITRSKSPISCPHTSMCSVVRMGSSNWQYDVSGRGQAKLINSIVPDADNWQSSGVAPFGKQIWNTGVIKTVLPNPSSSLVTYYFRNSFSVNNKDCYSGLVMDVVVHDGLILFLNEVEVFRANMPQGQVTSSTLATSANGFMKWQKVVLPLNATVPYSLKDGQNDILVEYHAVSKYNKETSFDMRVLAVQKATCSS